MPVIYVYYCVEDVCRLQQRREGCAPGPSLGDQRVTDRR